MTKCSTYLSHVPECLKFNYHRWLFVLVCSGSWSWVVVKFYSVSSPFSIFLSASSAATYISTALTCTTTIISLEPCALNTEFQHFMLRFNKISLLCRYHWKRGWAGKAESIGGEREGDFMNNFIKFCFWKTMNQQSWNLRNRAHSHF